AVWNRPTDRKPAPTSVALSFPSAVTAMRTPRVVWSGRRSFVVWPGGGQPLVHELLRGGVLVVLQHVLRVVAPAGGSGRPRRGCGACGSVRPALRSSRWRCARGRR